MAEDEKVTTKTGDFVKKHKTGLIVTAIVLVVIIFLYLRHYGGTTSASNSGSTGTGTNYSGTGTGSLDLIGPAGPAGPRGKQGPRGRRGKPPKHHHKSSISNTGGGNTPGMTSPMLLMMSTQHYTVKPGDTLGTIGAKHGTDGSSIYGMNRTVMGGKPVAIPGQRIRVR
jgi:LysM repeat protein